MRRPLLLALLALLALPASAAAVADCPDRPAPRTIASGLGKLEAITGGDGALFLSAVDQKAVLRVDAPGGTPRAVASGVEAPGGLAYDRSGLVAGQGDSAANGVAGNVHGRASLIRVDPAGLAPWTTFATGLGMANGVARGPDGELYASNALGTGIDRVSPSGAVERDWATVVSGNGLAVDAEARRLLVARTYQPARIVSVSLDDPSDVRPYATAPPESMAAGLDGLARGRDGTLFAAANGAGEVWRIGTDGSICALARGLPQTSAVAVGAGGSFPRRNVYAVTFGGALVELRDGAR